MKIKNPITLYYFHGKGKLFLHCDPKAFSNYFLLKNKITSIWKILLPILQTIPIICTGMIIILNSDQKEAAAIIVIEKVFLH